MTATDDEINDALERNLPLTCLHWPMCETPASLDSVCTWPACVKPPVGVPRE